MNQAISITRNVSGQGVFATSLTSDRFTPVSMVFAGDDAQATPYEIGTVVGLITASGKVAPYNSSNTDGTETAIGVLGSAVPIGDLSVTDHAGTLSAQDRIVTVYTHGEFKTDGLTGWDVNAATDLSATVDATAGTVTF